MEQRLRELIKQAMIKKKNTGDELPYQTYKNILEKAQKLAKDAKEDAISDSRIVEAAKKEVNHPRPTANALEVGACKSSD